MTSGPSTDTATLTCAAVRIDAVAARRIAWRDDARIASDDGYVIKNLLRDAGLPLRPWRRLADLDDDIVLVGVLSDATSAPTKHPAVRVRTFDVTIRTGEDVAMSYHFLPQVTARSRDAKGNRICSGVDAAEGATNAKIAYHDFAMDRLRRHAGEENVADAFALKGGLDVTRIMTIQAVRKVTPGRSAVEAGGGSYRKAVRTAINHCRANLTLTVLDAEKARAVMAFGVGPGKAFGFGSLLPASALVMAQDLAEEAATAARAA